jgi:hypothetical protein
MEPVNQTTKDIMAEWDAQFERLNSVDKKAVELGVLVGRYIQHQYADGYAYYQIIKENKKTVRIKVVDIGDGWVLPAWGPEATIPKDYALQNLRRRDNLKKLFGSE